MVAFSIYERRQTDGSDRAAASATASRNRIASIGLAAAVALTAVGATVVIIDVGHSGAKATWDEVGEDAGQDSENRRRRRGGRRGPRVGAGPDGQPPVVVAVQRLESTKRSPSTSAKVRRTSSTSPLWRIHRC